MGEQSAADAELTTAYRREGEQHESSYSPAKPAQATCKPRPHSDVVVVIPVRADPLVRKALCSIPNGVDVVVSMNDPSEEVRCIVSEFAAACPNLIVVETTKVGMAAAVNLGVSTARRDKIVMLDSDCELDNDTLPAYSRALDHSSFVRGRTEVAAGQGWSSFSGLGQAALNEAFARHPRLIGPSIAFRRSAFLKLGGYDDESGGSCDHEFVLRMEDKDIVPAYEPAAVIRHQPITFRIDCRSHVGYGRSMKYIDAKRGGRYGLSICLLRFYPSVLWTKLRQRGLASVLRSFVMGSLMLLGYCMGPPCPNTFLRSRP